MSTYREENASRIGSAKIRVLFVAIALVLATMHAAVSSTPNGARAAETTLSGSQALNSVVNWTTYRVNTFQANRVSIRVTDPGGGGGGLTVGLRKPGGLQFASASDGGSGQWRALYASGNSAIPYGGFYINSRITGSYGYCPPCPATETWSTGFRWDIQYQ